MVIWLVIITIMVVALTILALLRKSKVSSIEDFINVSGTPIAGTRTAAPSMNTFLTSLAGGQTNPATLQGATTTYVTGQQNYIDNVLSKEILTNPVMPNYANSMNPLINQADVYLNSPETIIANNLQVDNNSQFTNADIQWCRSAKMPTNLPPHVAGAAVGCGWYYVEDPTMKSTGALGQVDGPIFPKGPNNDGVNGIPYYGNGQWIWNLALAQQLEEIKNCKRIKSCIAIDVPSVNGICGFCPPSGYAIPTHADGSERYTKPLTVGNITAPAASCNTPVIMTGAACSSPASVKPTLVTPKGTNCGNYGYPSADYSIRLYSQTDCTENMGGVWVPNGECLGQGSVGSYSAECAPLNAVKPVIGNAAAPSLCTPDSSGKLSTACLISLAKSVGLTPKGSLIKMLQTGVPLGAYDEVAIQIVKGQNVPVNPVLYKGGAITVPDALGGYDNIYSLIKGGKMPQIQQAAMWLCIGSTGFDPCNVPDSTPGPFWESCLQQQWRVSGCQPAGSGNPKGALLSKYNKNTWGKVKTMFDDAYKAMSDSSNADKQDAAIQTCLGINTARVTPKPCITVSAANLILNADSTAFETASIKSGYLASGAWPSINAMYIGNLIANGTKSCDSTGVQFDGNTILGTPNLVIQLLGLPARTVINGPSARQLSSVPNAAENPPTYMRGTWVQGNTPVNLQSTNVDDQGNKVYMIFDDGFTKMANSLNIGKYYAGPISKYSPSAWPSYATAPTGAYVLGGSIPQFDPLVPIVKTGDLPWGDCGMGANIGINTNGNINVAGQYYVGTCAAVYIDPTTSKNLENAINNPTANSQTFKVTFTTANGAVWNGGTVTGLGQAFGNQYAWNIIHERKDGTGNGVGGGTISPQYQRTNDDKNWWNSLVASGYRFNMTINVDTGKAGSETRELWINPTVDTCEILAVLTGPTYTDSHTVMALYKGQLTIALQSKEKGYTFFSVGLIPLNKWSHIVHVYKEGVNDVYINGVGPLSMGGLTRQTYSGYLGYSLGGGSTTNPLYQTTPVAMPFKGVIGAFRVYNTAFGLPDVQNNLGATVNNYISKPYFTSKNDASSLTSYPGYFYVPILANAQSNSNPLSKYTLTAGHDSAGLDIGCFGTDSVNGALNACESNPSCVGFITATDNNNNIALACTKYGKQVSGGTYGANDTYKSVDSYFKN